MLDVLWEGCMLRFSISADSILEVKQQMQTPAVYLDHWALRFFSEEGILRERQVNAMGATHGTLVLSWINLLEFARVTDIAEGKLAESLIDEVLPNIFFIEANPFKVIDREDSMIAGSGVGPPHSDSDMMKAFANLKPSTPRLFTASGLVGAIQQSGLACNLESMGDTIVDRIENLRRERSTNRNLRTAVRRPLSGLPIERGTRYVFKELSRSFLIDQGITVTRNHALDLVHAAVSVSYCDYVLLDGHWQDQVERMKSRFDGAGMTYPLAKVYSKRNDGVESFLSQICNDTNDI